MNDKDKKEATAELINEELEEKIRAEEEELEEKKKRNIALKYFTGVYYDTLNKIEEAKYTKARMENFFSLFDKETNTKLPSILLNAMNLINAMNEAVSCMDSYFDLSADTPDAEDTKKNLQELNMSSRNFATLSMCASGEAISSVAEHMNGRLSDKDGIDFEKLRHNSINIAQKAVKLYKNGDPQVVAILLGEGLKHSCKAFGNAKTNEAASEWSAYAAEMLYMLDSNPKFVPLCGLNENQIRIAREVVNMGNSLRAGLQAVDILFQASTSNDFALTKEQCDVMLQNVIDMKASIYNRQNIVKAWDQKKAPEIETPFVSAPVLMP